MTGSDPYLLPGTQVLQNKLGITDGPRLERAERLLTTQRAREGAPAGAFDLAHLQAIHRHLFQDVYAWAGSLRTVEIEKDGSVFQPRQFLETGFADVTRRLQRNDYLRGLDVDTFAAKAGEIIGDINHAHPFREGNGRSQLEYLRQLAAYAGHPLDPGQLERAPWIAASRAANDGDYEPMSALIRNQAIAQSFLDRTARERLADPRLRNAQLTLEVGLRQAERQLGREIAAMPDVAAKMTTAIARQLGSGQRFDPPLMTVHSQVSAKIDQTPAVAAVRPGLD